MTLLFVYAYAVALVYNTLGRSCCIAKKNMHIPFEICYILYDLSCKCLMQ